jgi:enoyl-CoA hydratase/carnithine racemase
MDPVASTPNDILMEKRGGIAWVTFNRVAIHNAFDYATFGALGTVLKEIGCEEGARGLLSMPAVHRCGGLGNGVDQ